MYVKILGGILIIAATSAFGYTASMDLQKSLGELHYLKQLILMLRGEIKYTKVPLTEAFLHIGNRVREPYASWFLELSVVLERRKGISFTGVWEESIDLYLKESRLQQEEKEELKRLGHNMGYLDSEMQLGTIDLYLERLEQRILQKQEGMATKKRLCNCLGVMSGVFITVVLI